MEPPIQGLKRRSMVLLLAMSFSLMLWEKGRGHWEHWEPLVATEGGWKTTTGNWE